MGRGPPTIKIGLTADDPGALGLRLARIHQHDCLTALEVSWRHEEKPLIPGAQEANPGEGQAIPQKRIPPGNTRCDLDLLMLRCRGAFTVKGGHIQTVVPFTIRSKRESGAQIRKMQAIPREVRHPSHGFQGPATQLGRNILIAQKGGECSTAASSPRRDVRS